MKKIEIKFFKQNENILNIVGYFMMNGCWG